MEELRAILCGSCYCYAVGTHGLCPTCAHAVAAHGASVLDAQLITCICAVCAAAGKGTRAVCCATWGNGAVQHLCAPCAARREGAQHA